MAKKKEVDYTKPFPCGECGQMVMAQEKHTYEDCMSYKDKQQDKVLFELAKKMGDNLTYGQIIEEIKTIILTNRAKGQAEAHNKLMPKIISCKQDIQKMLVLISAFTKPNTEGSELLADWIKKYPVDDKDIFLEDVFKQSSPNNSNKNMEH